MYETKKQGGDKLIFVNDDIIMNYDKSILEPSLRNANRWLIVVNGFVTCTLFLYVICYSFNIKGTDRSDRINSIKNKIGE